MQLVDEETRRYRPTKNYLDFLQPPKSTFEVLNLLDFSLLVSISLSFDRQTFWGQSLRDWLLGNRWSCSAWRGQSSPHTHTHTLSPTNVSHLKVRVAPTSCCPEEWSECLGWERGEFHGSVGTPVREASGHFSYSHSLLLYFLYRPPLSSLPSFLCQCFAPFTMCFREKSNVVISRGMK